MDKGAQTWDLSQLSPYEREAWQKIQQWQESSASRRSLVPDTARRRVKQLGQGAANAWKEVPGSVQLNAIVENVLAGGNEALTDAVAASLQRDAILQAARRTGASVAELSDLRSEAPRVS